MLSWPFKLIQYSKLCELEGWRTAVGCCELTSLPSLGDYHGTNIVLTSHLHIQNAITESHSTAKTPRSAVEKDIFFFFLWRCNEFSVWIICRVWLCLCRDEKEDVCRWDFDSLELELCSHTYAHTHSLSLSHTHTYTHTRTHTHTVTTNSPKSAESLKTSNNVPQSRSAPLIGYRSVIPQ